MEAFILIMAILILFITYSFVANSGSVLKASLITIALAILFFIISYSVFYTSGEAYAQQQNTPETEQNMNNGRRHSRGFHGGFFYYGGRPYRTVHRTSSRGMRTRGLRSRGSSFRGRSFAGGGK